MFFEAILRCSETDPQFQKERSRMRACMRTLNSSSLEGPALAGELRPWESYYSRNAPSAPSRSSWSGGSFSLGSKSIMPV
jgi:hypothetical protein